MNKTCCLLVFLLSLPLLGTISKPDDYVTIKGIQSYNEKGFIDDLFMKGETIFVKIFFSAMNGTSLSDTYDWCILTVRIEGRVWVENITKDTPYSEFYGLINVVYPIKFTGWKAGWYDVSAKIETPDGKTDSMTIDKLFYVDADRPYPPALDFPEDGSVFNLILPTLAWHERGDRSTWVDYCELQIARDPDFEKIVVNVTLPHTFTDINGTRYWEYDFPLGKNGTYYWRVRAIDGAGNVGEWSDPRSFSLVVWGLSSIVEILASIKSKLIGLVLSILTAGVYAKIKGERRGREEGLPPPED